MMFATTRTLVIIAALFAGFLAGGNVDQAFVAMPAWQQLDAAAWAEFSRHADLGNGLVLYPLEAFAALRSHWLRRFALISCFMPLSSSPPGDSFLPSRQR